MEVQIPLKKLEKFKFVIYIICGSGFPEADCAVQITKHMVSDIQFQIRQRCRLLQLHFWMSALICGNTGDIKVENEFKLGMKSQEEQW